MSNGSLSKITPDVVKKLTEKLSEMMGEDITQGFEQVQNERGEFLNEEGLPIIDITEPVPNTISPGNGDTLPVDDGPLPLASLSFPVRQRLREQRDILLDQLEQEERLEQRREEEADLEERKEILRKRKEAAANEKARLNAAKEMQKKMGRALLANLAKEKAQEEEALLVADGVKRVSQGDKPKKSVAFADDPNHSSNMELGVSSNVEQNPLDWGDVTPARLRSTGRPSLLTSSDPLPMKMTVVERTPSAPPRATPVAGPDSDDESDLDSEGDHGAENGSDPEPVLEEDDLDLDFAQHQREIAIQYHEKRNKIGAAALSAMSSHSHETDGDVKMDVSLDMPSAEPEKPSISRFKATRLASSYNNATSPSTSLGASVIPATTARTLQKAIRTGKLVADERLVGGEVDSASDDENEGMQELLDLLKKGEIYNLGPDGSYLHVTPSTGPVQPAAATASSSSTAGKQPFDNLPPIDRPKTSRFKASRAAAGRPFNAPRPPSQSQTPISTVERSSPKLSPMTPTVSERPSAKPAPPTTPTVLERSSPKPPGVISPAVLERRPTAGSPSAHSSTFPSMIVDSPSFPAPAAHIAAPVGNPSGTSPFSMVVESPSFARPEAPVVPRTTSRPTRPPTIMSSAVQESTSSALHGQNHPTPAKTGKMSRFMMER